MRCADRLEDAERELRSALVDAKVDSVERMSEGWADPAIVAASSADTRLRDVERHALGARQLAASD